VRQVRTITVPFWAAGARTFAFASSRFLGMVMRTWAGCRVSRKRFILQVPSIAEVPDSLSVTVLGQLTTAMIYLVPNGARQPVFISAPHQQETGEETSMAKP
jgi:hypothetical protein